MIARLIRQTIVLGALWLASCGAPAVSDSEWPEPSPALWEVTGPDGQQGWLFGTVHALPDGAEWRTPLLDSTIAGADVLVVEVVELQPDNGPSLFASLSRTPGQPRLSERVDPEERPALQQLLQDAGMEDDEFADIETWAAALMLSGTVRSGDPRNGVDRALIAAADDIVGLESYRQQLTMFDGLSSSAQADLLYGVARANAADTGEATLAAWLRGDIDVIGAELNAALETSPDLESVLLTERNIRWAEEIGDLIEAGRRPFVAVGAGHLVGEQSLVLLLEQRGFAIRRIQ